MACTYLPPGQGSRQAGCWALQNLRMRLLSSIIPECINREDSLHLTNSPWEVTLLGAHLYLNKLPLKRLEENKQLSLK